MLRVGSVPYLVARPLDTGLGDEPGIEFLHDVPARLVDRLRASELDVALVSSIELFRRPGYGYVDGLAVGAEDVVTSVQVFLRRPIAEVRSVALDPASRTAATLTRVVWPGRADRHPQFVEVPAGDDPRALEADAWLRIGDRALREFHDEAVRADAAHGTFHPSAAWVRRTGLPFVFAVWIVRPGVDVTGALPAFRRARERGRRALGEVAREAALRWELPECVTRRYLERECLYEPGDRLAPALRAFRDAAAQLGLADAGLEPTAHGLVEPGRVD